MCTEGWIGLCSALGQNKTPHLDYYIALEKEGQIPELIIGIKILSDWWIRCKSVKQGGICTSVFVG